jgi:hypothetical protein
MLRSILPLLLLLVPAARAAGAEEAPVPEAPSTVTAVSEVSQEAAPAEPEAGGFQAPGRSRYLLGHSGMMLRRGEGFVSQKELFYTMASLGVTDHVTVTLGSVLPGLLGGRQGLNLVGGVKVGGSLSERLHLAGGVEMAVLPFMASGFGLAYGSLTYGTPDAHVTLGGGVTPLFYTNQFIPAGMTLGNVSGHLRLTQHLAAVTEHWVFLSPSPFADKVPMINMLSLRVMGKNWSVDLGAARIPSSIFVPWADLSWHWG